MSPWVPCIDPGGGWDVIPGLLSIIFPWLLAPQSQNLLSELRTASPIARAHSSVCCLAARVEALSSPLPVLRLPCGLALSFVHLPQRHCHANKRTCSCWGEGERAGFHGMPPGNHIKCCSEELINKFGRQVNYPPPVPLSLGANSGMWFPA